MRKSLLPVLCLLGLMLRIRGLTFQSLWSDELASSLWASSRDLNSVLQSLRTPYEGTSPGYPVFIFILGKIFGDSDWILRLSAALAGTLSIPVAFNLGKKTFGEREGWVMAVVYTLLRVPLYYSQEARPYVFVLFFATWNLWAWFEISFSSSRKGLLRAQTHWVVATALMCWFHYFGLIVFSLQTCFAIAKKKQLLPYAFVALLILPFWPLFSYQVGHGPHWIPAVRWSDIFSFFYWCYGSFSPVLTGFMVIGACFSFGELSLKIKEPRRSKFFASVVLLILPLFLTVFISKVFRPVFVDRYLVICCPAAYLLLARGLSFLVDSFKPWGQRGLYILFIVCLLSLSLGGYYREKTKSDFREVVAYVGTHTSECSDHVWVTTPLEQRLKHYLKNYPLAQIDSSSEKGLKHGQRFWYVSGAPFEGWGLRVLTAHVLVSSSYQAFQASAYCLEWR